MFPFLNRIYPPSLSKSFVRRGKFKTFEHHFKVWCLFSQLFKITGIPPQKRTRMLFYRYDNTSGGTNALQSKAETEKIKIFSKKRVIRNSADMIAYTVVQNKKAAKIFLPLSLSKKSLYGVAFLR